MGLFILSVVHLLFPTNFVLFLFPCFDTNSQKVALLEPICQAMFLIILICNIIITCHTFVTWLVMGLAVTLVDQGLDELDWFD